MDKENPFAAGDDLGTSGDGLGVTGRVDVVAALQGGTATAVRNVLPIAGGIVALVVVYLVSVCTCIGWLVTGPFMLHGLNRFMLSIVDGQPDFGELSSGVSGPDPMRVFLHGWGVILLLFVVLLPSIGVSAAIQVAQEQGMLDPMLGLALTSLVGMAWAAVIAPLTYASYVWADRGLGAVESYTAAFEAFRPSWGPLVVLMVVMQLAYLPISLLGPYMQAQSEAMATVPPDQAFNALGMVFGLLGVMYAYMAVVGGISMCWTVTAYRQVIPRRDPAL